MFGAQQMNLLDFNAQSIIFKLLWLYSHCTTVHVDR